MKKITEEINILKRQTADKFKKSEALNFLKEIADTLTKEEFIEFSDVVMLDAYRRGRFKAIEYMLSFQNKNEPKLLLIIHLQKMMFDKEFLLSKKANQILKVLLNHFSATISIDTLNNYVKTNKDLKTKENQQELLKMILEEKLPKNNYIKRQKL